MYFRKNLTNSFPDDRMGGSFEGGFEGFYTKFYSLYNLTKKHNKISYKAQTIPFNQIKCA